MSRSTVALRVLVGMLVSVALSQPVAAGGRRSAARNGAGSCPSGFVRIEAGSFVMGSPASEAMRNDDESQHDVTISYPFCMASREVTRAQYQALMGSLPPLAWGLAANLPLYSPGCPLTSAMDGVRWDEATAFADALSRKESLAECYADGGFAGLACTGYRLPTEAEWEYAARAGTTGATYADLPAIAWFRDNSESPCHRPGKKRPNAWGLFDMLGNAREWTGDWYGEYSGPITDPTGPTTGALRVVRGGSWGHPAKFARAGHRERETPTLRNVTSIGFRLVKTAQ